MNVYVCVWYCVSFFLSHAYVWMYVWVYSSYIYIHTYIHTSACLTWNCDWGSKGGFLYVCVVEVDPVVKLSSRCSAEKPSVPVCMYVYTYVCIYVGMYVRVYVYVFLYIFMHACMHICKHECIVVESTRLWKCRGGMPSAPVYMYVYVLTVHACNYTHTQAYPPQRLRYVLSVGWRRSALIQIFVYIHVYIHIHTHTHTHIPPKEIELCVPLWADGVSKCAHAYIFVVGLKRNNRLPLPYGRPPLFLHAVCVCVCVCMYVCT
jgi:hypothetical protein